MSTLFLCLARAGNVVVADSGVAESIVVCDVSKVIFGSVPVLLHFLIEEDVNAELSFLPAFGV